MGWPTTLAGCSGPTLVAGLVLGCAGADAPDPGPAPSVAVVTEIHPADVIGRRPRFISLAPKLAREGEPYQYGVFALEDGEEVRLTLVRAPEGAVLDGTILKWTPEHAQAGRPQRFTLRAVDEQGGAEDQTWTVTPRSEPKGQIPSWPRTRH
ncbi:MAG: hypothetical protein P4L36_23110 [Holophaga sp.]|nr:hypothetical protein [Holophaga sp.]